MARIHTIEIEFTDPDDTHDVPRFAQLASGLAEFARNMVPDGTEITCVRASTYVPEDASATVVGSLVDTEVVQQTERRQ